MGGGKILPLQPSAFSLVNPTTPAATNAFYNWLNMLNALLFYDGLERMRFHCGLWAGGDVERVWDADSSSWQVDFDKSKHMSDRMIRKRRLERERLEALEALRLEQVRKEREDEDKKKEAERSVYRFRN